ncbi:MAG: hypothetical protein EOP11_07480 [Proteobacteria bacterium]|nr:MAG: hypothetical protein EOP11_07480 [Pseudomonadota bacterium]
MPNNELQFYCGVQPSLHAVNVPRDEQTSSHDPRWEKRARKESDWSALPLQGAPAETKRNRTVVSVLAFIAGGLLAYGLKKIRK